MSDFDLLDDYEPEQPATLEEDRPEKPHRPRRKTPGWVYDAIALFFVAATIGVCLLTALLIRNPTLPINPLPPATPQPTPTLFVLEEAVAQSAATQEAGPATIAPAASPTPTPTETPAPTSTPPIRPTATGGALLPDSTNTPAAYPFTLQDETLTYVAHQGTEGCSYMAIAGQVFDVNGSPLLMIPVVVEGDELFSAISFSGEAPRYGPSGYEVFINDTPYVAEFRVRLIAETGIPLSEDVIVRTSDSCQRNVAIVNFIANQPLD